MNEALARVVEGLAESFHDLPLTTVVRVVTDCAAQSQDAEPDEVDRAARAALTEIAAQQGPSPSKQ